MKEASRNSFVSMVISHAAQLAYVEESRGAYDLLSKADRLLRYLDGKRGAVPLSEELQAVSLYAEILNRCVPNCAELEAVDSSVARASVVPARGGLVSAAAELLGALRTSIAREGPATLSLEFSARPSCTLSLRGASAPTSFVVALESSDDHRSYSR